MAQADSNLTTRRSFTTLMATAGAALAAGSSAAASSPDARLIDLGRQFDEIDRKYWQAIAFCKPLYQRLQDRSSEWCKAHCSASEQERMSEYMRIHGELGLKEIEASGHHPDELMNLISPIAEEILAIPSSTLAGLSVKARVVRSQASQLWNESEDDADWDDLCIRKLVEDILLMAARNAAPVTI